MNLLLDPNVTYLLLVGGFLLMTLALLSPGTGLIEVGAFFLLIVAGFGISAQTFNLWALLLLILGVVPFLLALRRSGHWIFLALSLLILVVGSVMLITTPGGSPAVNPLLAGVTSLLTVGFLWIAGRRSLDAMALAVPGTNQIIGKVGEARTDILSDGTVYVGGEEWSARSAAFIPSGSQVVVKAREGLVITVELKA